MTMKATGIIVEYNPLHYGHVHHIQETKKLTKPDCLIAVMSSSFTQRGEPTIVDKFTRAEMAIKAGVDLVIELPFVLTVQNADRFAYSSIDVLNKLFVSDIVFGSEQGDIQSLESIIDVMETKEYLSLVDHHLKNGHSFPTANQLAFDSLSNQKGTNLPNNILGLQYIKSLREINPSIQLSTIQRVSSGYYDDIDQTKQIQSATSIRKEWVQKQSIEKYVPSYVAALLKNRKPITYNLFTEQFKYLINSSGKDKLSQLFNMREGFENRILKTHQFENTDDLIEQLITRRYTYSAIKRMLAHLICQTPSSLITGFESPYIRVLGMNKIGKDYLSTIKKKVTVPIVTNVKENIHPYLDFELKVSKIVSLVSDKDIFKEEFNPRNVMYLY